MRTSLGQGTTVLAITPSCEPDWLDALLPLTQSGIAPSVVLLDDESFDAPSETSGPAAPTRCVGVERIRLPHLPSVPGTLRKQRPMKSLTYLSC